MLEWTREIVAGYVINWLAKEPEREFSTKEIATRMCGDSPEYLPQIYAHLKEIAKSEVISYRGSATANKVFGKVGTRPNIWRYAGRPVSPEEVCRPKPVIDRLARALLDIEELKIRIDMLEKFVGVS